MNAGFDVVLLANAFDQRAVANLAFVKRHALIHRCAMTAKQVVEHDHLFALFAQHLDRHAADVTRTASDQNCHLLKNSFGENVQPTVSRPGLPRKSHWSYLQPGYQSSKFLSV